MESPDPRVDERIHRLSEFMDLLSNAVRLQILIELQDGELCVQEIAKRLNRKNYTISRYLKSLRSAGMVSSVSRKQYRYFSLKRPALLQKVLELYDLLTRVEDDKEKNHQGRSV